MSVGLHFFDSKTYPVERFLDLQKDERDETQERDGYDNQHRIFTHRTTSALGLGGAFNARLLESVTARHRLCRDGL